MVALDVPSPSSIGHGASAWRLTPFDPPLGATAFAVRLVLHVPLLPHDDAVASYYWLGLRLRAFAGCPLLWGEVGPHYMLDLATLVVPRTHQQILGNIPGGRIRYRGADSLAPSLMHPGLTRPILLSASRFQGDPAGAYLSKRPAPVYPLTDTRVCSSLGPCVTWERHAQMST